MDLRCINKEAMLARLLEGNRPKNKLEIAKRLQYWEGDLPEYLVRQIGDYMAGVKTKQGRPEKWSPSTQRWYDNFMMQYYFEYDEYPISQRSFEAVRSRFNKKVVDDFWRFIKHNSEHDVRQHLQELYYIPDDYWETSILPKLR